LKASCRITAVRARTISTSEISPWSAMRPSVSFSSSPPETHQEVGDRLLEEHVLDRAPYGALGQLLRAELVEAAGLRPEPVRLGVVDRPHVRLGHRCQGVQDALLAAAGAGPVAGDERVVVLAHHEVVAERGRLRVDRVLAVEEPEVLL
jgi:hypothetical protein